MSGDRRTVDFGGLPKRIRSKIVENESGCAIWTGARIRQGYGIAQRGKGRGTAAVHRVVWELTYGPIPDGMTIGHWCHDDALLAGECNGGPKCPHRACVRHLVLQTMTEQARMRAGRGPGSDPEDVGHRIQIARGQGPRTHCKEGHPLTPDNVYRRTGSNRVTCRTCTLAKQASPHARAVKKRYRSTPEWKAKVRADKQQPEVQQRRLELERKRRDRPGEREQHAERARERDRRLRATDPEYAARKKQRRREWWERVKADPERYEAYLAERRERYATDREYRAMTLESQRKSRARKADE